MSISMNEMGTLSQLFKSRAGELSLEAHLAAIDDLEIRVCDNSTDLSTC